MNSLNYFKMFHEMKNVGKKISVFFSSFRFLVILRQERERILNVRGKEERRKENKERRTKEE